MSQIVWWEIETPNPRSFGDFTRRCGVGFVPAFVVSELGADYWIVRDDDKAIGELQRSTSSARPHAGSRLYVKVADLEQTLSEVRASPYRTRRR